MKYLILLIVFVYFGCAAIANPLNIMGVSFTLKNNILSSQFDHSKRKETYFTYDGVSISKDYEIIDTLVLDKNKRTIKIIILSPSIQEERDYTNLEFNKICNKRLMVGILKEGYNSTIIFINENAILNYIDYQNEPYKGISKVGSDIVLKFYTGSVERCDYQLYFKGDSAYKLYKINRSCYKIDLTKSNSKVITKFTGDTRLDKIKIEDLLK